MIALQGWIFVLKTFKFKAKFYAWRFRSQRAYEFYINLFMPLKLLAVVADEPASSQVT